MPCGWLTRGRSVSADAPDGWQAVVDALRPHIPGLWRRLSPPDKRLFLRHVARYWEVHRHRVPPATAERIDQLRSAGRLSVLRGRVIAVSDKATGLCVRIEQGARVAEVTAGWLINATGPAADVTATTDPLLRGLLDSGLARPDPLRLGIDPPRPPPPPLRDHRHSGDPRPGRRARGSAACRMPNAG